MADNFLYKAFISARDWSQKNGFDEIKKQDFYSRYHKVVIRGDSRGGEGFEHFITKAAIMYIQKNRGRAVVSELPLFKNGKKVRSLDVFDAGENNHIGVEDTSPEKDADFVIKISELPLSVRKGLRDLRLHIEGLIP